MLDDIDCDIESDDESWGLGTRTASDITTVPTWLRIKLFYFTYGPSFLAAAGGLAGWLATWDNLIEYLAEHADIKDKPYYPYLSAMFGTFLFIQTAAVLFVRRDKILLRAINWYNRQEAQIQRPPSPPADTRTTTHTCAGIKRISALTYKVTNPSMMAFEVLLNCGANFSLLSKGMRLFTGRADLVSLCTAGVLTIGLLPAAVGGIQMYIDDTAKHLATANPHLTTLSIQQEDTDDDAITAIPNRTPVSLRVKLVAGSVLMITLIGATWNDNVTMRSLYIDDIEKLFNKTSDVYKIIMGIAIDLGLGATFHVKLVNSYYRLEKYLDETFIGDKKPATQLILAPNNPLTASAAPAPSIYNTILTGSEWITAGSNLVRTCINMTLLVLGLIGSALNSGTAIGIAIGVGLFVAVCSFINIKSSFKVFNNHDAQGEKPSAYDFLGYDNMQAKIVLVKEQPQGPGFWQCCTKSTTSAAEHRQLMRDDRDRMHSYGAIHPGSMVT